MLPLIAGAAMWGGKKLFGKAIKRGAGVAAKRLAISGIGKRIGGSVVGRAIGGIARSRIGRVVGSAAIGAGALEVAQQYGAAPRSLPAIPSTYGGGVPATTQGVKNVGFLPAWRGPGGKLQWPWQDPRIPEYLKQFALDDAYLKPCVRAPRGYVVLRDQEGRPFAVNKMIAKQFKLWKPKAKPIISVRDWHSYQRAQRVEKKLRKIASKALRHHGHKAHAHCVPFARRRKAA